MFCQLWKLNKFFSFQFLNLNSNWIWFIWQLIGNSSVNMKRYECGNVNNGIFRCHPKNHNNFRMECLCHSILGFISLTMTQLEHFFSSLLAIFIFGMIQNYIIIIMRLNYGYSIEIIISNHLFSVFQPCGKTVSIIINIRYYMCRMNVRAFAHCSHTTHNEKPKRNGFG